MSDLVDLLIIGGGINGAGIACDAAGRGLSVHLCEQNDLASGTSSKSTKLIHGGLRYLEYYEFRLVSEALKEREILLRKAPHLIKSQLFVLPHHPKLRPAWMIQAGLFLYDHLAKRTLLPASSRINLPHTLYGEPLTENYQTGFIYPDCWVDDARLVIANAMAAKEKGAQISTYCKVQAIVHNQQYWQVQVLNQLNQQTFTIHAHAIVNATGPWVTQLLQKTVGLKSVHHLRMIKGSHIIIPKLYQGDHAYILQQTDARIIFAIPYQQHWTLIGTTEIEYQGNPSDAQISVEEIDYLCAIINSYFKININRNDVIWSFAGVRPLFDNQSHAPKAISRDYAFEINDDAGKAPFMSILGGKITTYRMLAEHALEKLKPYFPQMGRAWTAHAPLPGGDIPDADFNHFLNELYGKYRGFSIDLLTRLAHQYGTRIEQVLGDAQREQDLGQAFGGGCYQREIDYLIEHEWLHNLDDLLFRRTKLGLHLQTDEIHALEQVFKSPL